MELTAVFVEDSCLLLLPFVLLLLALRNDYPNLIH